jgi:hypothetical protein
VTGRKLLFAVTLLFLALVSVGAVLADVKAQSSTQVLRTIPLFKDKTALVCDSLNNFGNAVVFPGNEAEFFK